MFKFPTRLFKDVTIPSCSFEAQVTQSLPSIFGVFCCCLVLKKKSVNDVKTFNRLDNEINDKES